MVKASELKHTELRCGNLVYNPNLKEIRTVDYLDIRDHAEKILYTPFEGIELSEEWLQKLGFQERHIYEEVSEWRIGNHRIQTDSTIFIWMGYENGIELKHVHQLQNLFFSLTGRELELTK